MFPAPKTPMLLPGETDAPFCTRSGPLTEPLPPSSPPVTVVVPLKVLLPLRRREPPPDLLSPPSPETPTIDWLIAMFLESVSIRAPPALMVTELMPSRNDPLSIRGFRTPPFRNTWRVPLDPLTIPLVVSVPPSRLRVAVVALSKLVSSRRLPESVTP